MTWIKRKVDEHVCRKPRYDSEIRAGDVWQCDECKNEWEVVGLEHGTQWDPINPPLVKWKRLPGVWERFM